MYFSLNQFNDTSPGFSARIEKNGKVISDFYLGLANIEQRKKIDKNTQFRLASISKPFTAMAILVLIKKGKIRLDDTIDTFLSDLPKWSKQITIENLLNHTSGIPEHEPTLYKNLNVYKNDPTMYDALAVLGKEKKLLFLQGSQYRYSNAAYVLLALVVEKISRVSFSDFLKKEIVKPLGLKNTTVMANRNVSIKTKALGYKKQNNSDYVAYDEDPMNYILGDEGIYSTPSDLLKWWKAWKNESILPFSLLEKVFTVKKFSDGKKNKCGLSWFIKDTRKYKMIFHTGSWVGFTNIFVSFFDKETKDKITVVFLSNTKNFPTQKSKFMAVNELLEKANLEKYAMMNL